MCSLTTDPQRTEFVCTVAPLSAVVLIPVQSSCLLYVCFGCRVLQCLTLSASSGVLLGFYPSSVLHSGSASNLVFGLLLKRSSVAECGLSSPHCLRLQPRDSRWVLNGQWPLRTQNKLLTLVVDDQYKQKIHIFDL